MLLALMKAYVKNSKAKDTVTISYYSPHSLDIRTTCINPYFIDTGMFKGSKPTLISFMLPILQPDYVANRVVAAIR